MALIYKGNGTEAINDPIVGHIPARDLSDGEVQEIADKWQLSLAQTEGLLMKHKLYSLAPNERPLRAIEEEAPKKRKGDA